MKRRLRKKKKLGEFTEFGFSVDIVLVGGLPEEAAGAFLDDWILSAIEENGLQFGGLSNTSSCSGFVALEGSGTATERHRRLVDEWLSAHSAVDKHAVGQLKDAWH